MSTPQQPLRPKEPCPQPSMSVAAVLACLGPRVRASRHGIWLPGCGAAGEAASRVVSSAAAAVTVELQLHDRRYLLWHQPRRGVPRRCGAAAVDRHLLHAAPELLPLAVYYQVVTTAGRSQPRSEWMQHMDSPRELLR
jgi:hypothetical protein